MRHHRLQQGLGKSGKLTVQLVVNPRRNEGGPLQEHVDVGIPRKMPGVIGQVEAARNLGMLGGKLGADSPKML